MDDLLTTEGTSINGRLGPGEYEYAGCVIWPKDSLKPRRVLFCASSHDTVGMARTRLTAPVTVYWLSVAETSVAPAVAAPFHPVKNPGSRLICLSSVALSMMNCAFLTGMGGIDGALSG